MSFLAGELERQGMNLPLLIGGATTSRVHTAVKIDPNYRSGPVVHVNDASRAVGVASSLLSPDRREAYAPKCAPITPKPAAHFRAQADKKRLKLADARANAVAIDFAKSAEEAGLPWDQIVQGLRPRRIGRIHRLDAVLPDLGTDRAVSPRSSTTRKSAKSRARCMTTPARCSTASSGKTGSRRRRPSVLAGQC